MSKFKTFYGFKKERRYIHAEDIPPKMFAKF